MLVQYKAYIISLNVTCSFHDKAETLLIWSYATTTHSNIILAYSHGLNFDFIFSFSEIITPYLPSNPKCLEVFARNLQPGWVSFGNEVTDNIIVFQIVWTVIYILCLFVCLMVFNDAFNNISVMSWQSVLLVEEIGRPGENHRPVTSH